MKDNFIFMHPSGMGMPTVLEASSIEGAWKEARSKYRTGGELYQKIPEWRALDAEAHHNDNGEYQVRPELAEK